MKKILVIDYSQSGQLTTITRNFTSQFSTSEIEYQQIQPKNKFPFPWTTPVFFDAMPETVLEKAIEIEEINYKHSSYDLIIIGYQPWFLSPSQPILALLKDVTFQNLINNTPVVTVIGSRNMWLNAQESVKQHLVNANAKLIGNIALSDRSNNLIGVITILHWMLTGEKTKKWGIFPKPGVSDEDIEGVKKYGIIADSYLQKNDFDGMQQEFAKNGGVPIDTNILFIEGRAKRLFIIWANLIIKKAKNGKRAFWVNCFKYYLIFALFIVSPILLLIYNLFIYPFVISKVKRQKIYFQGVQLK